MTAKSAQASITSFSRLQRREQEELDRARVEVGRRKEREEEATRAERARREEIQRPETEVRFPCHTNNGAV